MNLNKSTDFITRQVIATSYNISAVTMGKLFPGMNLRFLICETLQQSVRSVEKSNELVCKVFPIQYSKYLIKKSHRHIIHYNVREPLSNSQHFAWLNRLHKETLVSRCWHSHLCATQRPLLCMWTDRFIHKLMAPGTAVFKDSSSLNSLLGWDLPFSIFSVTFNHQWSFSLLYLHPVSLFKGNKCLLTGSGVSGPLKITTRR